MLDFVLSMLKPHAGGNFKTTKPDGAGDGRRPRRPAAKAAANPDDGIVIDLTSSDDSDTDTDGGEERGFFPALAPEASKRPLLDLTQIVTKKMFATTARAHKPSDSIDV